MKSFHLTSLLLSPLVVAVVLLLNASATVAASSPFDGTYKLVELYDKNFQPIPLVDGSSYECTLRSVGGDTDPATEIDFNLHIGNSIMTTITTVTTTDDNNDDDSSNDTRKKIQIGPIAMTEMMPPEPIWRVEMALTAVLPKLDQMENIISPDDGSRLVVMKGNEENGGKLVLNPVED